MARKRIGAEALTAAEKQKRHREKKADEENAAIEEQTIGLRKFFHTYLDQLSDEEFTEVFYTVINGGKKLVTLKKLSELTGVSEYELKKMEARGFISQAVKDREGLFTDHELSQLKKNGITPDQFLRLAKCHDKEFTYKELSDFTGIPVSKLEAMQKQVEAQK